MKLHRAPDGLRRCRCKSTESCPYGGPVAETVTRIMGTPEEKERKRKEREEALKKNPQSLVPKLPIASTGRGKHIREESLTEDIVFIKKAREAVGRLTAGKQRSALRSSAKSLGGLRLNLPAKPQGEGPTSLQQRNGEKVSRVLADNCDNDIEETMSNLAKSPDTRAYLRGGGFETHGSLVGDKKFTQGTPWGDLKLENNDFKTRVFPNGNLSVEITVEGEDHTTWVPVGSVSSQDLASGAYLLKVDKAITKLGVRKRRLRSKEVLQEELKGHFAKTRTPKVEKPTYLEDELKEIQAEKRRRREKASREQEEMVRNSYLD